MRALQARFEAIHRELQRDTGSLATAAIDALLPPKTTTCTPRTFFRAAKLRGIVDVVGLMAGVDEVGRGPLAGPVVAAAVILEEKRTIRGLNDSKLLHARRARATRPRDPQARDLRQRRHASVAEIDTLNILRAALLAMRRAVEALREQPQIVLVDGNQRPQLAMPVRTVVGGDARVRSISAASIIAKVHRDASACSCTTSIRNTASTATRATRRPST